ncbi:16530_t:CDS:1, partial [Acaulospora morrowiae]
MEETNFAVDTGQGFKLQGTLYLKDNAPSDDIVIFCHGLMNTRNSEVNQSIIKEIDFNSISFDFQ